MFAFGIPFPANYSPHSLWPTVGVKVSPRSSSGEGVPTGWGVDELDGKERLVGTMCHYGGNANYLNFFLSREANIWTGSALSAVLPLHGGDVRVRRNQHILSCWFILSFTSCLFVCSLRI